MDYCRDPVFLCRQELARYATKYLLCRQEVPTYATKLLLCRQEFAPDEILIGGFMFIGITHVIPF